MKEITDSYHQCRKLICWIVFHVGEHLPFEWSPSRCFLRSIRCHKAQQSGKDLSATFSEHLQAEINSRLVYFLSEISELEAASSGYLQLKWCDLSRTLVLVWCRLTWSHLERSFEGLLKREGEVLLYLTAPSFCWLASSVCMYYQTSGFNSLLLIQDVLNQLFVVLSAAGSGLWMNLWSHVAYALLNIALFTKGLGTRCINSNRLCLT